MENATLATGNCRRRHQSRIEAHGKKNTAKKNSDKEVLQDAYDRLTLDFDEENGGFGTAPKFPRPHKLLFLLRYYARTGEKNALAMAEKTLTKMRLGGIYDQLGFGFHRYSTDDNGWFPTLKKCSTTKP